MRSTLLILCATAIVASSSVRSGQAGQQAANGPQLFSTHEVVEFSLEAPFEQLIEKGRQDTNFAVPGTLKYLRAGSPASIDGVQISTRGHTSLQASECDYPKLKLKFGDPSRVAGSPFAGMSSVKIGTHCGDRGDADFTGGYGRLANEKAAHREAFVYRLLSALGVPTLLARPARITYVFKGTVNAGQPMTRNAMLLEDDDDASRRLGATGQTPSEQFPSARTAFTPADTARIAFAQALIGNFDWCLLMYPGDNYRCDARHPLWNMLALTIGGASKPLIYDFDLSGMVVGRHTWFGTIFNSEFAASEPEVEVIAQVQRTRTLFDRAVLDQTRRSFVERKAVAYDLLQKSGLEVGGQRSARAYLDAFYAAIESDEAFYRPVVVTSDARLFLDNAATQPLCGTDSVVPQGTPVRVVETSGTMSKILVLDALWKWAKTCEGVRKSGVWITANAIGTDFPK